MRRLVTSSLLCCFALSTAAFGQTSKATAGTTPKKDATPAVASAPPPPSPELMKARRKPPLKGTALVEFMSSSPKVANGEVASVIKVKNVDNAPIIGLKIDEYFYAGQKEVSACTARVRSPIAAGEIVDVPISCPNPKERVTGSNMMFTHANGKVQPKQVKKFADAADPKAAAASAKKK
jgi:hypothetical protein